MKWTVGFLVVLGVVAAVCAVFLVNALRVDSAMRGTRGEVPVVLMTRNLPAMGVLTADAVEIGKAKAKDAPVGYFTSPAQAIGRIAATPLVKEQILTKFNFISEGSGAQLAAALPAGMRAVSITLTSQSISEGGGLLYPGCIVDVLASFKLSGGFREDEGKGEAISTTLLHAIQVLAVEGESVVSQSDTADKAEKVRLSSSSNNNQKLTVTLLVNPKQAEALQLALDNGSVSLTMRNPLDTNPISSEATVLSRGKLSRMGSLLEATVNATPEDQNATQSFDMLPYETKSSNWNVTVIRGNKIADEEVKKAEE